MSSRSNGDKIVWDDMLKEGMTKNPEKMDQILKWKPLEDKNGVKSFLQTLQLGRSFLKRKNRKTYVDVTLLLRRLTNKSVRFDWTEEL